jgi:hypothetical protein
MKPEAKGNEIKKKKDQKNHNTAAFSIRPFST